MLVDFNNKSEYRRNNTNQINDYENKTLGDLDDFPEESGNNS